MNVFKEMALSVYSYGSYSQFLKNRKSKVFGFGVLLMAFYFVLIMLLPGVVRTGSIFGLADIIDENVPDFSLKDGLLWVDDVIEYDAVTSYIYIDTDSLLDIEDEDEIAPYFKGYRSVMIMDYEKMVVKNNGVWQMLYFSDADLEFDKDDLIDLVPFMYVIYVIFMAFAYIWMTALFFFGVLFVALIGMIIASCMNYRLTFGQLYLMGIYSRTLPLLIKALVSYLPFGIPFFWVLNFGISALIIGLAIMNMKKQTPEMSMSAPY